MYGTYLVSLTGRVVDSFVQEVLRDYALEIDQIEIDVSDYLEDHFIKNKKMSREQLHENLKQQHNTDTNKNIEKVVHEKLLSTSLNHDEGEIRQSTKFIAATVGTITEPVIRELVQLVLRDDRVRIRRMYEIEERGLDDPLPFFSNVWLYHKDLDLNKIIEQISTWNEGFSQEDDIDYGKDRWHNLTSINERLE
jgi:hypothetical protein